jgi:hypothetical protein
MTVNFTRPALITASILLIPFIGMQLSNEWDWGLLDFVIIGALLFCAGMTYELVARKSENIAYKAAVALAAITGVLIVWVTLAVGIIGEDNPANLLYLLSLVAGFLGAIITGFKTREMTRVMIAMAISQMVIPLIALIFWSGDFAPGVVRVFGINVFFAMLWIGSALLFRNANANKSLK